MTTSEVRRADKPTDHGEPPQREMTLGLAYLRAIELAGGLPGRAPAARRRGDPRAARAPRRRLPVRRPGPAPRRLRRTTRTPSSGPSGRGSTRSSSSSRARPTTAQLPILGICRGAQALNVARGGTLHQHLPDVTDGSHRAPPDRRPPAAAPTRSWCSPEPRSRASLGGDTAAVNSFHHQAVDAARATGLRAVAHAPGRRRSRRSRPSTAATSAACSGTPRRSSTVRPTSRSSPGSSRRPRSDDRPRPAGVGHLERGGARPPVLGRRRGGGDAASTPRTGNLASRVDDVLAAAGPELLAHLAQETHGSAVELRTDPHRRRRRRGRPARAAARPRCATTLRRIGPAARPRPARTRSPPGRTSTSRPARASRRCTARCASWPAASRPSRCTCTSASPDPEVAMRAMNRMRAHVPLLLALQRQLAVLAGARQRAGLRAHAAVPGLPARRAAARVRRLRGPGRRAGRR